jgi:uncharacterized damage-inducible protein DinB
MTMQTPKQQFLDQFKAEHATTMKVLRAYPPDQADFRPHPRSQSARELAWTFVVEQTIISRSLAGPLKLGAGMPKPPEEFQAIIEQFDREYHDLVAQIEKTPDSRFEETVKFFSGPGQLADFAVLSMCWFMLCDQIHHRGQYSVYLRMAGGKVPAIYGPSADEPWT